MVELPRKIQEYEATVRRFNILYQISRSMSSTLDLNEILRIILASVTYGNGFGFNRAFLFLVDEQWKNLVGKMAVGPDNAEEAGKIWQEIREKHLSLEEFLSPKRLGEATSTSKLDEEIKKIKIPVNSGKSVSRSFMECCPINLDLEQSYDKDSIEVEEEILNFIGYPRFCIIPLVSFTRPMGVLIIDNKYNHREIDSKDVDFLYMLGQQAAIAIENAHTYEDLRKSIETLERVNREISSLKEYNENIVENVPISLCVVNHDCVITGCNKNFCKMLGLSKKSVLGLNITNLGVRINGHSIKRILRKVLKRKRNKSFTEVFLSWGDEKSDKKEELICNLQLAIFKDPRGKVDGVIIAIDDVTQTVKLERLLEDARRLAHLGELAASVAHEIRNPLVSIGGYARRLRKKCGGLRGRDLESLDIIIEEVERLENIVRDTLDFVSKKSAVFSKINLCKLLKQCIDLIGAFASKSGVTINFVSGYGLGRKEEVIINGSGDNLKQAFINLLKNSVEASYVGEEVNIELDVSEENGKKWAMVSINNKGDIIAESDFHRIFLPFYSTKKDGTGLGLSVTKRIIEQHSGEIEVKSDRKTGTTFVVKLPVF